MSRLDLDELNADKLGALYSEVVEAEHAAAVCAVTASESLALANTIDSYDDSDPKEVALAFDEAYADDDSYEAAIKRLESAREAYVAALEASRLNYDHSCNHIERNN
ncbi:MAG: hypothetical protein DDT38_01485 [Firmicutes bacterium]|nr:hypothetical protein [candidate division NPL-UPA2 bacterium]